MSETRSEKFEREQKQSYLENAREMYRFCLGIGLSEEDALVIARLPLTMENLQYIQEATGTLQDFKRMVKNLYLKIERNRIESMQLPVEKAVTEL